MPCYHPLKAFILRVLPDGTKKLKITSYQVDHVEQRLGDENAPVVCTTEEQQLSPMNRVIRDFLQIPCGQCLGCRLDYSRTWANRLMMELEDHEEAWFLTLTYDNEHVRKSAYADPETGEANDCYTLSKRDFQLFMKRLRKEYSDCKIRFFASGEYGSNTARPHYHVIVYGLHFEDGELKYYKKSGKFKLWKSERLNRVWNCGFVVIAPVSWDTCAYTARYVMKKAVGKTSDFYEKFNIEPEFCLMSRKPGIARHYYETHKDQIYQYDKVNLSTGRKGINNKPPTYFDRLFAFEDEERIGQIKEQRKLAAERSIALELERTDLSYLDYLAVKERELMDKSKAYLLERSKV